MPELNPLHLKILDACQAQAPEPLYPRPLALAEGLERGQLDEACDDLRTRGLIQFTEWTQSHGQGYALTAEGARFLNQAPVIGADHQEDGEAPESGSQRGAVIRRCLLAPGRPVVTRLLLVANLLVFGIGWHLASQRDISSAYLSGQSTVVKELEDLDALHVEMGALTPKRVIEKGQWWRLLSYSFLHNGLLHLLLNLYFLYSLGSRAEGLWGWWRYAVLYLVAAAAGGAAACQMSQAATHSAVGAGGVLCGWLLSVGVWLFLSRAHLSREQVMSGQTSLLMSIILMVVISFLPGVLWTVFLGGAIGGLLVSIPLYWNRFGIGAWRWVGIAGMSLAPAAVLAVVYMPYNEAREINHFWTLVERHRELDLQMRQFLRQYGQKIINEGPAALGDDQPLARERINQIVKELKLFSDRVNASQFRSTKIKELEPGMKEFVEWQLTLGELYQQALSRPGEFNAIYDRLRAHYTGYEGKCVLRGPPKE